MAIEDETTYGLTGAQVKDLADKVNNSGVKTLTLADYDYPTDNPTSIFLGNLAVGEYTIGTGEGAIKVSTNSDIRFDVLEGGKISVFGEEGGRRQVIVYGHTRAVTDTSPARPIVMNFDSDNKYVGLPQQYTGSFLLTYDQVASNLTTGANGYIAAASAVKELYDYIRGSSNTFNAGAAWKNVYSSGTYTTKRAFQVTMTMTESSLSVPASTWTTLFTITQVTNKPARTIEAPATFGDGTSMWAGLIRILSDGGVELYSPQAATEVHTTVTWPVAG